MQFKPVLFKGLLYTYYITYIFICTMAYYSTMRKKEVLPFVATWVDLGALC